MDVRRNSAEDVVGKTSRIKLRTGGSEIAVLIMTSLLYLALSQLGRVSNLLEYYMSQLFIDMLYRHSIEQTVRHKFRCHGRNEAPTNYERYLLTTLLKLHSLTIINQGIWMCRGQDMNVMVMDVEGTDGRERGEDQVRFLIVYISFLTQA